MCDERRYRQRAREDQVRRFLLAIQSGAVTPQDLFLFHSNIGGGKLDLHVRIILSEEKEILGSYSAALDRQEESANLVFSRALPVSALITHRFSLEEFGAALSLAARPNNSLKILVIP